MKDELKNDLESTRFISILSDGSTEEQELVYVWYIDENGNLNTKLADIVKLEHGHASGVKDGSMKAMNNVGVDEVVLTNKLVGINTDGASVN